MERLGEENFKKELVTDRVKSFRKASKDLVLDFMTNMAC
jgi:hypothetical protein